MTTQHTEVTSIKAAMSETTLSRGSIYNLLKEGKLKSVKIGGRRLILRDSLRDLLSCTS